MWYIQTKQIPIQVLDQDIVINNISKMSDTIIKNIVEAHLHTSSLEKLSCILRSIGLTLIDESIDTNATKLKIISSGTIYNIENANNPIKSEDFLANKLNKCPSYQKLQNSLFIGWKMNHYIQNIKYEFHSIHGENLYMQLDDLMEVTTGTTNTTIYNIGYHTIQGQTPTISMTHPNFSPKTLASYFTDMLAGSSRTSFGNTNNSDISSYKMQLNLSGFPRSRILDRMVYINRNDHSQLFIKYMIDFGNHYHIDKIHIIGTTHKQAQDSLNSLIKTSKITLNNIISTLKNFDLINDNIHYKIKAHNQYDIYIYTRNKESSNVILHSLKFKNFNINHHTLMDISQYNNLKIGNILVSDNLQTMSQYLKNLTGVDPIIQQEPLNMGMDIMISSGTNRKLLQWKNGMEIFNFNTNDGVSLSPLQINIDNPYGSILSSIIIPRMRIMGLRDVINSTLIELNCKTYMWQFSNLWHFEANLPIKILNIIQKFNTIMINNTSNIKETPWQSVLNTIQPNIALIHSGKNYTITISENFNEDINNEELSTNQNHTSLVRALTKVNIGYKRNIFQNHNQEIWIDNSISGASDLYTSSNTGARLLGALHTQIMSHRLLFNSMEIGHLFMNIGHKYLLNSGRNTIIGGVNNENNLWCMGFRYMVGHELISTEDLGIMRYGVLYMGIVISGGIYSQILSQIPSMDLVTGLMFLIDFMGMLGVVFMIGINLLTQTRVFKIEFVNTLHHKPPKTINKYYDYIQ